MHIRRPLCAFSLIFVLMLWGMLSVIEVVSPSDISTEVPGIDYLGTIKKIEVKDDKLILQIKDITFQKNTDKSDSSYYSYKSKKKIYDSNYLSTYNLKSKEIRNALVYVDYSQEIYESLHIGALVVARGSLENFKSAMNRGQFDACKYYRIKRIDKVSYDSTLLYTGTHYDYISDRLYRLKEKCKGIYSGYFKEDKLGIVEALVLGDKSNLDSKIKEMYQNAGILHILALSGLHIATLGLMLFGGLRRLRIPIYVSSAASSVIMLSYGIMTGMSTSTVRALIMFVLGLIASIIGRTYDLQTGAAIACDLILIENPYYLYDAGFLLSFSAVMGIGLLYPSIKTLFLNAVKRNHIEAIKDSKGILAIVLRWIFKSIGFSLVIQLATLPFTLWFYYQIPTYGIIANLVVIPLTGVLLISLIVLLIIGGIIACVVKRVRALYYISYLAYLVCSGILELYEWMTLEINKLPGGLIVAGRPSLVAVILYYIILMLVILMGGAYRRNKDKNISILRIVIYDSSRSLLKKKSVANAILAMLIVGVAVITVRRANDFEISTLYVGQGQCIVIHGEKVPTIIYDCGSTDEMGIGKYKVIPFLKYMAIDTVEAVVISHLDTDHVSGLLEMLENGHNGITINSIFINCSNAQTSSSNYKRLISDAQEEGIKVYRLAAGNNIDAGSLKLYCLWPYEADGLNVDAKGKEDDINAASTVIDAKYVYGSKADNTVQALLTGDINSEIEEILIPYLSSKYDFLQVPHHGSSSGALSDFYKKVSPELCVISAGLDNQYGHPHEETRNIIEGLNYSHGFITYECGEIDYCIYNGEKWAQVYLPLFNTY